MAENTTPAPADHSDTTDRVERAVRQLQDYYAEHYGSEFAALVSIYPAHDDFDL